MHKIKFKIADIVIELNGRFKMETLNRKEDRHYLHFLYTGNRSPDIELDIEKEVTARVPHSLGKIFTGVHPLTGYINWNLYTKGNRFIIEKYVFPRRQLAYLNKDYTKGTVHLSTYGKYATWKAEDIVYDLLQIILINHISHKEGVFVHGIALKDTDGRGLLFAGPTQSGKSTTAHLWHRYTKAAVLNDDRIIIRKLDNSFFIYGSPWHGDFNKYDKSNPDKAELKRIFFIRHGQTNTVRSLKPKEAFGHLYPNIFPTFWNKNTLEKQTRFCREVVTTTACGRLGFKKDRSIIDFVRAIR